MHLEAACSVSPLNRLELQLSQEREVRRGGGVLADACPLHPTVRMGVRVPAAVGHWQDGGPCSCCCRSLVVLRKAQRNGKCQLKGVITRWHPYSQEGSAAFREMSWSPARPCDLQEAKGVTETTAA